MAAGEYVENAEGDLLLISNVEIEYLDEPVTVYNFEVKNWHTYYVSDAEVFVHNTCSMPKPSKTVTSTTETPINVGTSRPRDKATPNSIYEQINPNGTVKSRAFYDQNGNQFNRQDFDHRHFDKKTQKDYQPHEHNYHYNNDGYRDGEWSGPLQPGYNNMPTM